MASTDGGTERRPPDDIHEQRPPVIINDGYQSDGDTTSREASDHRASRSGRVDEHRIKPAKTSTAAVFALIFGLSAVYAVLTVLLSPVGLILALIGLVLAFVGFKATKQVGVTGKGVAVAGLVLSAIALIGAVIIAAGVTTFLNDDEAVQRFENGVQDLRDDLPTDIEVPTP